MILTILSFIFMSLSVLVALVFIITIILMAFHYWLDIMQFIIVIAVVTMIFGGPCDQYQMRYSTWDEAQSGHDETIKKLRMITHEST